MEYVEGESLAQLVKRRSLPLSICARIISEAARGLHAAHQLKDNHGRPLNVVHRDVSPGNVLISYDGAVKVVDFGVAKARTNLAQTQAGTVKGKFSFMAPEQLKPKEFGAADRRADIFALGILLYEASTHRRLFKGEDKIATIGNVLEKEVLPPSLYVEGYPDELAQICMRALERRPENRYQTAEEMHLALEAYLCRAQEVILPGHVGDLMKDVFRERMEQKGRVVRGCLAAAPRHDPSYSVLSTVGGATGEVVSSRGRRIRAGLALTSAAAILAALIVVLYSASRTPEPTPAAAPPPVADVAPTPVPVSISVSPPSAAIVFDGKPVLNPYNGRFLPVDRAAEVRVSATGYRSQTFTVSLREGGRWTIALERLPAPPALKKKPKPPKKKPGLPELKKKPKLDDIMIENPYEK
jgi:serine/threonine-protein kinase